MDLISRIKILQNHFSLGNFHKVLEGCKILLKKNENNSFILNLAGMSYQRLSQHTKSIEFFLQSLKIEPSNIAAKNNLANSYKSIGNFEKSRELYEQILKLNPEYVNAYNNYANLKTLYNDYEGAIKLYEKAIKICDKNNLDKTNILFALASAYQSLNRIDESKKTINLILQINEEQTAAHKLLSSILKYEQENKEASSHIQHMQKLLMSKNLSNNNKIDLYFSLGKAFDDLKDFENAFKYFTLGNNLKYKKGSSNIKRQTQLMANIEKTFKDINFENTHKDYSDKKIIFICGMPRSGTTLTEQIISSHKEVYGAGELIYLYRLIQQYFLTTEKLDKNKILDFTTNRVNTLNNEYFQNFSLHNLSEKKIITDKAPQNFLWIGFIKIFFPNSKIIHLTRNPRDNCLSLYKNSFASAMMSWTYNQIDIANYYNAYKKLMSFWIKKIPKFIYNIDYEKLVSNKNHEIKKLLEFCELSEDEGCYNHHKNTKTPIKTASISQARQPIYKSSVNYSNNYTQYFSKMFDMLE